MKRNDKILSIDAVRTWDGNVEVYVANEKYDENGWMVRAPDITRSEWKRNERKIMAAVKKAYFGRSKRNVCKAR